MCHAHTKRKHYSQEQALEWMIQIAKGLRYLHTSKPKVLPILSSLEASKHAEWIWGSACVLVIQVSAEPAVLEH